MLNSCGHALSQGEVSDFHPGYNWEATPPGYNTCVRAWRWLVHTTGPHLPGLTMAQKSWENMGMLASVANCGRSRKWGYRGRLALGFKPRQGGHDKYHHAALAEEDHAALGLPLPCCLGSQKARLAAIQNSFLAGRTQERRWGKETGERNSCWWTRRRYHVGLD